MSLTIAVLETMGEILETVITSLVQINAIPIGPVDLYHYTGLETI